MKTLIIILSLTSSVALACDNNFQCSFGQTCVKSGRFGEAGYCAKEEPVNQNNAGTQPTHVVQKTCKGQFECSYPQTCVIPAGAAWGVCQ